MKRMLLILIFAICECVFAADVIERVTVLGSDDSRAIANEKYERQLRATSSKAPRDAGRGDQLILHAGKSGQYMITVSDARRSNFGNTIIHGKTPTGGKALLVISPTGSITGNFYQYDGKVMVSTGNDGIVTAWREGIDALALPIDDGAVTPPSMNSRAMPVTEAEQSGSERAARRQVMKSEKPSGVRYPEYRAGASELSVLLYHDDTMVDPTGVADYITTLADEIFLASEVAIKLKIAGFIPVPIQDDALHRDLQKLMSDAESPFTNIDDELLSYEADVAILLRDTRSSEESICGIADLGVESGRHFYSGNRAVVEWLPRGNGTYCRDKTFAHELGHLLGAKHHRGDYESLPTAGYSYSFGYLTDSLGTVMVPSGSVDSDSVVYKFSNPKLQCGGVPCGREADTLASADNSRAFLNSAPLVADGAKFNFENMTPWSIEKTYECEKDGLTGVRDATALRNQTKYAISIASWHFVRADESSFVKEYELSDRVLERGYSAYYGYCDTEESESRLRSEYIETFARYYHPITGEIVESGHLYWDVDYDGEYSLLRIAKTNGGTFEGHPEQSVRVGASYTVQFESDYGYELNEIRTSCDGTRAGDSFTVIATADNCRVELMFARTSTATTSEIQVTETYIGLLDRAPDPNGLAYWVSQLNRAVAAGQEATFAMKKLTNDIALSPEWTAGLGANDVTTQVGANAVVQGMYQNLFERVATQADLDWWTPQLTGGSTTASEMALNLITAAKSNTEKPADGNVMGFKREAATYYVQNVLQANYTVATARSAVKDVNDAESLAASKTATDIVKTGSG